MVASGSDGLLPLQLHQFLSELCVKRGQICQSCLPKRLGNCVNTVQTQTPPQVTALTDPSTSLTLTSVPASQPYCSTSPIADTSNVSPPQLLGSIDIIPETPLWSSTPENEPALPQFNPRAEPVFTWGEHNSSPFISTLNIVFEEDLYWRPNLFKVPYGKAGKSFVLELARLYRAFATSSALELVALKAATLLPILPLQKPSRRSKTKDHITCIGLNNLLREGRAIQQCIPTSSPSLNNEQLSRSFAKLMFEGKTKAALRLLMEVSKGSVLHLDDIIETENGQRKVRDILTDKHPRGQPACHDAIINDDPSEVHPILFEPLDGTMIRSAALQTSGAAGPSGLDAFGWRRLCTSFELCHSLALTVKRLSTELVDPVSISPLMASRLIALDKNPGVHPIGIGDTARRIITKAILNITRQDIQEAAGSIQLCSGQISGIEAAAMLFAHFLTGTKPKPSC